MLDEKAKRGEFDMREGGEEGNGTTVGRSGEGRRNETVPGQQGARPGAGVLKKSGVRLHFARHGATCRPGRRAGPATGSKRPCWAPGRAGRSVPRATEFAARVLAAGPGTREDAWPRERWYVGDGAAGQVRPDTEFGSSTRTPSTAARRTPTPVPRRPECCGTGHKASAACRGAPRRCTETMGSGCTR